MEGAPFFGAPPEPPETTLDAESQVNDESVDRWRRFAPRKLIAGTIVFPAVRGTKTIEYIRCLVDHGLDAIDILSVQVSTGNICNVTLSSRDIAESFAITGFTLKGNFIRPQTWEKSRRTVQLHIHDVPIWVSDCAITSALSEFGTVRGAIRHGRVKVEEGLYVASGVRFATFDLNEKCTSVPSYIRSADGKSVYRMYHEGQTPTCRFCNSTTHLAKACPKKRATRKSLEQTEQPACHVCSSTTHLGKDCPTSTLPLENEPTPAEAHQNNDTAKDLPATNQAASDTASDNTTSPEGNCNQNKDTANDLTATNQAEDTDSTTSQVGMVAEEAAAMSEANENPEERLSQVETEREEEAAMPQANRNPPDQTDTHPEETQQEEQIEPTPASRKQTNEQRSTRLLAQAQRDSKKNPIPSSRAGSPKEPVVKVSKNPKKAGLNARGRT